MIGSDSGDEMGRIRRIPTLGKQPAMHNFWALSIYLKVSPRVSMLFGGMRDQRLRLMRVAAWIGLGNMAFWLLVLA